MMADIATQRTEQAVLECLVGASRELAGARYATALLVGTDGAPSALARAGMTRGQVAALPHLPRPVGLIGTVLTGQTLRLARMEEHPGAVDFPGVRAPMAAFLGVPVTVDGRVLGGLYLTRPPGQPVFDDDDQAVATALAAQTGSVVTALRSAAASQELVDGLGLTADRGTDPAPADEAGSPVVRRLLATARSVLGLDMTFLSRIGSDTQTFTAVDADAGAPSLAEGTVVDVAEGYCTLMLEGTIPAAVPDVRAHPLLGAMAVTRDIGVGAYCGVPVRLPDGTVYGTLCGLHSTATEAPTSAQLEAMAIIAGLLGDRVAKEQKFARAQQVRRDEITALIVGPRSRIVVQPIVDLADDQVRGYEALSRFTDVTGAPRRPDRVFAEAAAAGLGVHLELAAARAALTLVPDLPDATYLSVNPSPAAVCTPAAYDLLTELPLDRIVLELTEHERVADYSAVLHALSGLRTRGLRLAIDDTGSGFAGLQHLAELNPDIVKLAIAFVRNIDRDPTRRAVARAVIGFAAEVGAALVAEGIETPAELDQVRRLGAGLGQGFFLGRPRLPGWSPGGSQSSPSTARRVGTVGAEPVSGS